MLETMWTCVSDPDGAVCAVATVVLRTWPLWLTLVIASILVMPITLWLMWSTIGSVRDEIGQMREEDRIRARGPTAHDVARQRLDAGGRPGQ